MKEEKHKLKKDPEQYVQMYDPYSQSYISYPEPWCNGQIYWRHMVVVPQVKIELYSLSLCLLWDMHTIMPNVYVQEHMTDS